MIFDLAVDLVHHHATVSVKIVPDKLIVRIIALILKLNPARLHDTVIFFS